MTDQDDIYRRLIGKINADPDARRELHKLAKKVEPTLSIPEYEAESRITSQFEERLKEQREELARVREEQLRERVNRQIDETRAAMKGAPYHLTDQEIAEVEKIMTENGVQKWEVAAGFYRSQHQPLRPSGFGNRLGSRSQEEGSNWRELMKDPNSELLKAPKKWGQKEFDAAFEEAAKMNQ
jgi:hypothetical protein